MMNSANMPTTNNSSNNESAANSRCSYMDIYDIPKPATPVNYDLPKTAIRRITNTGISMLQPQQQQQSNLLPHMYQSIRAEVEEDECYDVPRPLGSGTGSSVGLFHKKPTLTPSSSNSSIFTTDSLSVSFSSSNRSSMAANFPDYDIPRRNPIPVHRQLLQKQMQSQQTQQQPIATTIVASTAIAATPSLNVGSNLKVLPLNLNSALETLAKLHTESTNLISR